MSPGEHRPVWSPDTLPCGCGTLVPTPILVKAPFDALGSSAVPILRYSPNIFINSFKWICPIKEVLYLILKVKLPNAHTVLFLPAARGCVYFLMPLIALCGQSFVVQLSDERNVFSFNIQEFTEDQYLSCFIGFFISYLRRDSCLSFEMLVLFLQSFLFTFMPSRLLIPIFI